MAKVITIAQQKGGTGKTTIAAHLAVVLSNLGYKISMIDIDPQGSLSSWYAIRNERFGKAYTGVSFISTTGWRVNSEIIKFAHNHDFIIIDSPPHTETETKTAIRAADMVIIPLQPSPADLWATQATIDLSRKENKLMAIILNRVPANSKLTKEITSKIADNLLKNFLGNRVAFASCMIDGKCVTETEPTRLAAREIKAVVVEILSLFGHDQEANLNTRAKFIKCKENA